MDLDARQTRNLLLAGTAPLPTPYSKTGVIAVYMGHLTYGRGQQVRKRLLMVLDPSHHRTTVQTVVRRDVAALYIDGEWDDAGNFQISAESWVDDFERGEWFLLNEINDTEIRRRLGLQAGDDISTRESILRGVAFVSEGRPLLQSTEVVITAGEREAGFSYECCRTYCKPCCKTCC